MTNANQVPMENRLREISDRLCEVVRSTEENDSMSMCILLIDSSLVDLHMNHCVFRQAFKSEGFGTYDYHRHSCSRDDGIPGMYVR